jgi:signal peptidase II
MKPSAFNRIFNLNISNTTLIIATLPVLLISLYLYKLVNKNKLNLLIKSACSLCLAGAICSLIDKILWGGSLDYLVLSKYIIDLKDIYLYGGALLLIIYTIKNFDPNQSIKDDLNSLKSLFSKKP